MEKVAEELAAAKSAIDLLVLDATEANAEAKTQLAEYISAEVGKQEEYLRSKLTEKLSTATTEAEGVIDSAADSTEVAGKLDAAKGVIDETIVEILNTKYTVTLSTGGTNQIKFGTKLTLAELTAPVHNIVAANVDGAAITAEAEIV